jgi:hypothetical protein
VKDQQHMAQKTIINMVDDLDGTKADFADFPFALDGVTYEIDLSTANRDKLFQKLEDFLAVARRTGGRRRSTTANGANGRKLGGSTGDTGRNQLIREWARENGHPLGDRGRIPNQVVAAYDEANSQSAPAPAAPAAKSAPPRKQASRRPRTTTKKVTAKAATKTA